MLALKAKGTTVVLITHRMAVLNAADKIALLKEGVLQSYGARDDVLKALYRFDNGQRSVAGFSLHSHFACKIQKEQLNAYNALLSDIDNMASQSGYAILNIPALEPSYEHEHENFKAHQRHLYQNIINQANALAKDYGAILGKACTPKRIDFGQSIRAPMMKAAMVDMTVAEASGAAPVPNINATLPLVQEGREFSASANVSLECK